MIRINLLPVRQGASAQAGKQVLVIFAVLLIAEAAGLFYYQSGKDAELAVAQARNRKLSAEIKKLTTQTKKIDQLEKEAVELEQQQLVLDGLVDGQTGPVRVLAALATLLSPIEVASERLNKQQLGWDLDWDSKRLWIDSFKEEARHVDFHGHARTNEDLAEFLHRLGTSIHFVNINLDFSELVKLSIVQDAEFVRFHIEADCIYGKSDVGKLAQGTLGVKKKAGGH